MTFTPEEATMARLRDKYSHGRPAAGVDAPGVPDQAIVPGGSGNVRAQSPEGTGVDVRLCAVCQGAGTTTEVYEHRRLERTCEHCSGQGVLVSGGAQPAAGAAGPQLAAPPASARHAGQAQLRAAVARYEQELADVRGTASGCSDEQQRALTQALADRLRQHLARLQGRLASEHQA